MPFTDQQKIENFMKFWKLKNRLQYLEVEDIFVKWAERPETTINQICEALETKANILLHTSKELKKLAESKN